MSNRKNIYKNRILCTLKNNSVVVVVVVELYSKRVYFHNVFVKLVLKEEEELGSSSSYSLFYINHGLA